MEVVLTGRVYSRIINASYLSPETLVNSSLALGCPECGRWGSVPLESTGVTLSTELLASAALDVGNCGRISCRWLHGVRRGCHTWIACYRWVKNDAQRKRGGQKKNEVNTRKRGRKKKVFTFSQCILKPQKLKGEKSLLIYNKQTKLKPFHEGL